MGWWCPCPNLITLPGLVFHQCANIRQNRQNVFFEFDDGEEQYYSTSTSWPEEEWSRINNSAERQSSDTAILRPSQCFHSAPLQYVFTQPLSFRPSSIYIHSASLQYIFTQPLFNIFSLRPSQYVFTEPLPFCFHSAAQQLSKLTSKYHNL